MGDDYDVVRKLKELRRWWLGDGMMLGEMMRYEGDF